MPETIDIHIHLGAPKGDPSGCYWSDEFEKGFAYRAMRLITIGIFGPVTAKRVEKHMQKLLQRTKRVQKVVFLALDESHDENGRPCPESTHLHVPNRYVRELADKNSRVLFGASIHPYRPDAIPTLEECIAGGAVLCKWLPSSQAIDPDNPKCDAFYDKLAKHHLPLLCHVGPEGAIPPLEDWQRQRWNNPKRLRRALDKGVTVIAAHCAIPLLPPPFGCEEDFLELGALFDEAPAKGWKLYADLSALFLGTRSGYVEKVKRFGFDRLLLGSDYPIPILDLAQGKKIGFFKWLKRFWSGVIGSSALDRNLDLLTEHGFPTQVFTTAATLFSQIVREV